MCMNLLGASTKIEDYLKKKKKKKLYQRVLMEFIPTFSQKAILHDRDSGIASSMVSHTYHVPPVFTFYLII